MTCGPEHHYRRLLISRCERRHRTSPGRPGLKQRHRLSIRLRGLKVTERRDPDLPIISGNDLVVVTKPRFGSVPPVRRLHALEPGWKNDFLYDV